MIDYMIDSEDNLDEFFQENSHEVDLNICFHYSDFNKIMEKHMKKLDENGNCVFDDEWSGTLFG